MVECDSEDTDPNDVSGDSPSTIFGDPLPLTVLNSIGDEDDPTLTADELELYFASTRTGNEELWRSTRGDKNDPWTPPTLVESLNSPHIETNPEISPDGSWIVFATTRTGTERRDIYYAQRTTRGGEWTTPQRLAVASTPYNDFGVGLSLFPEGFYLCRESREGGLGQTDIWWSAADLQTWSLEPPELVSSLSTPVSECSMHVSLDGTQIYFDSRRGGNWDLWTAQRDSPGDEWGDPVPVMELNSTSGDGDPWLSPDRRTIYYASQRGPRGNRNLYMATRP